MSITDKDRKALICGLKKYNEKGVLVTIDGRVCQDSDWDDMLLTSDAPYFYKASAIEDCSTGQLTELCFTKTLIVKSEKGGCESSREIHPAKLVQDKIR